MNTTSLKRQVWNRCRLFWVKKSKVGAGVVCSRLLNTGYEPQRLSIQLDRPISEAREQPSDGGDLCGSRRYPGASCASKALLVVIANGPYTVLVLL